jgi:predicted dehydrogenase
MNQAVHTIDLLLWLFGPVRRVFGRVATRLHPIEVEDTAVAVLEFASGALGTVEASTSAYPGYSRRLELTGSEGTVVLDGDRLAAVDLRAVEADAADAVMRRLEPSAGAGEAGRFGATATVSASSPIVADASAHQRVLEDFIRAVTTKRAPCCDGRDGRHSVAVIEAIYGSSRTNQSIDLM